MPTGKIMFFSILDVWLVLNPSQFIFAWYFRTFNILTEYGFWTQNNNNKFQGYFYLIAYGGKNIKILSVYPAKIIHRTFYLLSVAYQRCRYFVYIRSKQTYFY